MFEGRLISIVGLVVSGLPVHLVKLTANTLIEAGSGTPFFRRGGKEGRKEGRQEGRKEGRKEGSVESTREREEGGSEMLVEEVWLVASEEMRDERR